MLEFNGYLTDKAKEFYIKEGIKKTRIVFLVLFLSLFPGMLFFSLVFFKKPIILIVYIVIVAVFTILPGIIFKSPEKQKALPNKVLCSGTEITSVSEAVTVTKSVNEAKLVIDFGDFYVIKFPGFKSDEKFICQKSLLTVGSLEKFEKLFNDKITKQ